MRHTRRLIALGIGLGLGFALVAQAGEARGVEGIATYPMTQKPTDAGVHTVIIEAPRKAWGLRRAAHIVDSQVPGLAIAARPWLRCNTNVTCIPVTMAAFGTAGDQPPCGSPPVTLWAGCAQIGGTDPWIALNVSVGFHPTYACHELLHALGMNHHTLGGCLSSNASIPSAAELQTLREMYP